jgi:hypothetical protein
MTLDSRIRFGIQDLIDSYDKTWKTEIHRSRQEAQLLANTTPKATNDTGKAGQAGRNRRSSKVQEDSQLGSM